MRINWEESGNCGEGSSGNRYWRGIRNPLIPLLCILHRLMFDYDQIKITIQVLVFIRHMYIYIILNAFLPRAISPNVPNVLTFFFVNIFWTDREGHSFMDTDGTPSPHADHGTNRYR